MKYICIEGNIGSGKTSMAKKLATHFNARFLGEEFEANPFLPLFYQDPERFSFALEFSFLLDRARQLNLKKDELKSQLHFSDYYVEKCLYFAQHNLESASLDEFLKTYPSVAGIAPSPDLLIFLHLPESALMQNIRARGREFEQSISEDYLRAVNDLYLENSRKHRDYRVLNFHLPGSAASLYDQVFGEIVNYLKFPPSANELTIHIG